MTDYTKETLEAVAANDVAETWRKDVEYERSWKKRGGVGAFMMLARKWDRLETQVRRDIPLATDNDGKKYGAAPYDILAHIRADKRPEGLLDDIRDLRRYLMLVEAELVAEGTVKVPPLVVEVPDRPLLSELLAGGVDNTGLQRCIVNAERWVGTNADLFATADTALTDAPCVFTPEAVTASASSADVAITRAARDGMEHPFGFNAEEEIL